MPSVARACIHPTHLVASPSRSRVAPPTREGHLLLGLQRTAGNQAVTGLVIQRDKQRTTPNPLVGLKFGDGTPKHRSTRLQPRVAVLQQQLNNEGASLGLDGQWGKQTDGALQAFEGQHGFEIVSVINEPLGARLLDGPPTPQPQVSPQGVPPDIEAALDKLSDETLLGYQNLLLAQHDAVDRAERDLRSIEDDPPSFIRASLKSIVKFGLDALLATDAAGSVTALVNSMIQQTLTNELGDAGRKSVNTLTTLSTGVLSNAADSAKKSVVEFVDGVLFPRSQFKGSAVAGQDAFIDTERNGVLKAVQGGEEGFLARRQALRVLQPGEVEGADAESDPRVQRIRSLRDGVIASQDGAAKRQATRTAEDWASYVAQGKAVAQGVDAKTAETRTTARLGSLLDAQHSGVLQITLDDNQVNPVSANIRGASPGIRQALNVLTIGEANLPVAAKARGHKPTYVRDETGSADTVNFDPVRDRKSEDNEVLCRKAVIPPGSFVDPFNKAEAARETFKDLARLSLSSIGGVQAGLGDGF